MTAWRTPHESVVVPLADVLLPDDPDRRRLCLAALGYGDDHPVVTGGGQ